MKKFLLTIILGLSLIGCSSLRKLPNREFLGNQYTLASASKDYKISLQFAEENFFGFAGVNNYFGKYQVEGNTLKFGAIGATMMSGPTKAMNAEMDYLDNLEKVNSFYFENGQLILQTTDGKKLLFNKIEKP
ncbi:META domain-containing protein [Fusobacterium sp. MFO224]|uniref:META domain-containing protein n=1 Tax=Fusobacterium sp. MFO224 TaxID=3378070 RepID=UPI0038551E43